MRPKRNSPRPRARRGQRCPREPIRHRWTSPALATTRSSKLLEQHGTATAEILSAEIGEGATEGMTPSSGRLRWSAWTARYGDPTAAFLRLAAEFGVVTVDGPAVSLTPLGAWAVIHQVGAKVEVLSASAALTPIQLIICWLGMSGETFEQGVGLIEPAGRSERSPIPARSARRGSRSRRRGESTDAPEASRHRPVSPSPAR
jgi:hypothetical protein